MRNIGSLSRSEVLSLGELHLIREDSTMFSISAAPVSGKTKAVVVVSKAVAKRAVERNLLRRRIKHALDTLCVDEKFRGWRIMVRAKKPTRAVSYGTLSIDIGELLERISARYNTRI